jgi:hypothetical protein
MARSRTVATSLVIGLGLGPPACTEFGPRVYTAQPYHAEEPCVAASVAIGLVQADELESTCAPICLLLDETLYVSVVCAPYPARSTRLTPEDSADCALALTLLESHSLCGVARDAGADGASESPAPPL